MQNILMGILNKGGKQIRVKNTKLRCTSIKKIKEESYWAILFVFSVMKGTIFKDKPANRGKDRNRCRNNSRWDEFGWGVSFEENVSRPIILLLYFFAKQRRNENPLYSNAFRSAFILKEERMKPYLVRQTSESFRGRILN